MGVIWWGVTRWGSGLDLWVTLFPPYHPVQGAKVSKKGKRFQWLKNKCSEIDFGKVLSCPHPPFCSIVWWWYLQGAKVSNKYRGWRDSKLNVLKIIFFVIVLWCQPAIGQHLVKNAFVFCCLSFFARSTCCNEQTAYPTFTRRVPYYRNVLTFDRSNSSTEKTIG